jgi:DNA-binding PadR family transcriptional regulator
MVTGTDVLTHVGFDIDTINTLERNKLIEKVPRGTPNVSSAISYRITSLGIQFLNQARQKKTNNLLLTLTIILSLIGIIQIILIAK